MSKKLESFRVGPELDRRRKLTDGDKEKIKNMHADGIPIRRIAAEFAGRCSRRLIQFVIFPERLASVNYPGHWKKYRPGKEEWARTMRERRSYKRQIINSKLK